MLLHSVSENLSDKSRFLSTELSAIKVCLKYRPPSLALYYRLTSYPKEHFLHKVTIEREIEAEMTAEDIYKKLIATEPAYWSQRNISRRQIIRLIVKLQEKSVEIPPQLTEKYIAFTSTRDEKSSYVRQLTIESNLYESPVLATSIEDATVPNSESIIINPIVDLSQEKDVKEAAAENSKMLAENNCTAGKESPFKNMNSESKSSPTKSTIDENRQSDNRNSMEDFVFIESNQKVKEALNEETSLNKNESMRGDGSNLEKIYIEELGQDAYMDQSNNPYDIKGNFIGSAEIES
eukprot:TRINITY_DN5863_c0_g1_i4.p1 TRINITY_DN5863_c0_g1~~TRINITY_DN5863_c0_g1_i4.p1  ORF type:complete len:293 (+),score=65.42 TRINITY_DN5863_c0_g1_i4:124-1002(+)